MLNMLLYQKEGRIEGPSQTSQYNTAVMYEGFQGDLRGFVVDFLQTESSELIESICSTFQLEFITNK